MKIGLHVEGGSKNLTNTFKKYNTLGANAFQIFVSTPKYYASPIMPTESTITSVRNFLYNNNKKRRSCFTKKIPKPKFKI